MKALRKTTMAMIMAILASLAFASAVPAAAATTTVPAQFIGKLLVEAYGQAPTSPDWSSWVDYFKTNGCNTQTVRHAAYTIYTSPKFLALYPDDSAKLLTLYRGVFSREPDKLGFGVNRSQIRQTSWSAVVSSVLDLSPTSEFTTTTNTKICKRGPYGWGANRPIAIGFSQQYEPKLRQPPTAGYGYFDFHNLQEPFLGQDLASQINTFSNRGGGTFYLPSTALFSVTATITVPGNVAVTTFYTGTTTATNPLTPTRYALMARLVRDKDFNSPAIVLMYGARLDGIWIDGARARFTTAQLDGLTGANNIFVTGAGVKVKNVRSSDSAGGTSISAGRQLRCKNNPVAITGNLITAFAAIFGRPTTDGITNGCDNAMINLNQLVDVTDTAIVLLPTTETAPPTGDNWSQYQQSDVISNTIVQVANTAWAGIALDGLYDLPEQNFQGSVVSQNIIWSDTSDIPAKSGHYLIALAVGTRPWWADRAGVISNMSVTANHSGGQQVYAAMIISVDGVKSGQVSGNAFAGTAYPYDENTPDLQICTTGGTVVGDVADPTTHAFIQGGSFIDVQKANGGCLGLTGVMPPKP